MSHEFARLAFVLRQIVHNYVSNFNPVEVVCRCCDPQLQVGENLYTITE